MIYLMQEILFIEFQPKRTEDIDAIIKKIHEEIANMLSTGFTETELRRGIKKSETDLLTTLESNQKQAYIDREILFSDW